MNCKNCAKNCCKNFAYIAISCTEFMDLYKIKPFDYEINGFEVRMLTPCAFFDDKTEKCTIYAHRPLICRLFPFTETDNSRVPDKILLSFSMDCSLYQQVIEMSVKEREQFFKKHEKDCEEAVQSYVGMTASNIMIFDVASKQDRAIIEKDSMNHESNLSGEVKCGGMAIPVNIFLNEVKIKVNELSKLRGEIKQKVVEFKQIKLDHEIS